MGQSRCVFCDGPVEASGVTDGDRQFCSPGCREVAKTLDPANPQSEPVETNRPAGETTYLHVDGMHCHTCERFLESVATEMDGVYEASGSYVTETVRVEHDPVTVAIGDLCQELSIVGYTVMPRDEVATVADEQNRRSDERQMDDLLGFRYAAGIMFGMALLFPYIVVLYPAQAPWLFGLEPIDLYAGGPGPGDAVLILPLFLALTSVVLFFTGLPLLRGAYISLKLREPNTDLLVTITIVSAYLYGTLAFLSGRIEVYYDLTIVIAATVVAAIYYESLVKQRAVDRLSELTVSQVSEARLREPDGSTTRIAVEDLGPGDVVEVHNGERIPVDGTLENSGCSVDEAVVTGESLPVHKTNGDSLVGGSLVVEDTAVVRVGNPPTSSLDSLTTAVWDIQSASHGVHRTSDRVAGTVVPALGTLALAIACVSLFITGTLYGAVLVLLATLIVCCPWAVGLSTPLSVATAIREGLSHGIIVFDETVFERLRATDVVVFDKTGTLTTGEMHLVNVDAPTDLLGAAAALERHASHPAGAVIADEFEDSICTDGGTKPQENESGEGATDDLVQPGITDVRTHATGIAGRAGDQEILVGNLDLFTDQGWSVDAEIRTQAVSAREAGNLPVVVGADGAAGGLIVLGDTPRSAYESTIERLADRDIEIVVLTGDEHSAATQFDIDRVAHVFAGVPPDGKTETIRRLQQRGHVTMIGDGTNDGPAISAADLGISMGTGTALAAEAADIALTDSTLATVERTFELAEGARRRLLENTGLALGFNACAILFAIGGLLNPLSLIAATVLTAGSIAANSTRSVFGE